MAQGWTGAGMNPLPPEHTTPSELVHRTHRAGPGCGHGPVTQGLDTGFGHRSCDPESGHGPVTQGLDTGAVTQDLDMVL